jgi:hypothetical protein
MKLVVYSKNDYYFLTDEEFEKATESWSKDKPIFFRSRGLYLPLPKKPVGVPPEHAGLQLAFTFNDMHYGMPGWIGIQKPSVDKETGKEFKPGALYVRVKDHSANVLSYRWHNVNPNLSSDEVRDFIKSLKPIMAEDILKDEELRTAIPFEPLLSDYYLN